MILLTTVTGSVTVIVLFRVTVLHISAVFPLKSNGMASPSIHGRYTVTGGLMTPNAPSGEASTEDVVSWLSAVEDPGLGNVGVGAVSEL